MVMICCGREARESHSTRDQGGTRRVRWGLCKLSRQGLQVVVFSLYLRNFSRFEHPPFLSLIYLKAISIPSTTYLVTRVDSL